MELKVLQRGWRRHLKHFRSLRRRLAGGQDPKVFCLSCSDSRVSVHEIFELDEPGSIFEVKNVGGLFSDDAKAGLVFALAHLKPEYLAVLHHTQCGGYKALSGDIEPDIKRHMVEFSGLHAKLRVDGYLSDNQLALPEDFVERLVVEEGCRIQVDSVINFLMLHYPKFYREVREKKVTILPLIYDVVSGRVYKVPRRLDGSEGEKREEF